MIGIWTKVMLIAIIAELCLGCGQVAPVTVPKTETVRCPVGKPLNTLPVRGNSASNATPAMDDLIDMAHAYNNVKSELVTCRDIIDLWESGWEGCE